MSHGKRIAIFVAMITIAAFESGCAWVQDDSSSIAATELVVTSASAPFYIYGPAQTTGPDFDLKKGDLIEVMRGETGYTYGRAEKRGVLGYVSNADLGPYIRPRARGTASSSSSRRRSSGNWRQEIQSYHPAVEPPLPGGQDPLGLPQLLAPSPSPAKTH
ncbi:MAG: hypothetical protein QM796_10675 [Chthoniobacteraceae bacterium]